MSLEAGWELATHTKHQGINAKEITWNSEAFTHFFMSAWAECLESPGPYSFPSEAPSFSLLASKPQLILSTVLSRGKTTVENPQPEIRLRFLSVDLSPGQSLPPILPQGRELTKNSKMMLESG